MFHKNTFSIHIPKYVITTFVFLTIIGTTTSAQSLQTKLRKQLFNFDWRFNLGDTPEAVNADFDDNQWRLLDLPHDWSIEGRIDPTQPMGNDGGYFPAGMAWYRKEFKTPKDWKNKMVSIYFEGVYMNSEVFINGKSLGVWPYGYSSFRYDLTPHLLHNKKNVISVKVDNSQHKNSRWYSGSGIYRHVWLEVTDPVHIDHWGVAISTPQIDQNQATVQLKVRVKNETDSDQTLSLSTQLLNKNNSKAGNEELNFSIPARQARELTQTIKVEKPLLWSPETPDMYQAEISIRRKGKTIDQIREPFGIRSIGYSADKGFLLNGESVIINGGCVHHDNGSLGAAAYDRAEVRKVQLLKSAGFNAVRTAHNPPSEAFLHACDSIGLLVMDEAFDGWRESKTAHDYAKYFDEWWQRDLEAMVLRDRNHPSIVFWSTGNEIIERKKPEAVETARMLADHVRRLDPTRPVTSAMTTWDSDWEIFDPMFAVHDIGGYNYQLYRAPSDHERVPSRVIVNTESYPRDAFHIWELVQDHSYIIGDFVWTALDYLGESGIGRYYYPGELGGQHWENNFFPWHGAYCGDIDLTGWRKPISHYRDLLYNEDKKLYIATREPNPDNGPINETMWSVWPTWESWTWPGKEGRELQVEVYSRYPKVRLYLNDLLIGEQLTGREQEFKATFAVPYAPGNLRAVGLVGDKEIETITLQTAGKASKIKLTADRTVIAADGQDISYVTVEITDFEGVINPSADHQLQFTLDGPGKIIAVDNARLNDPDPYVTNTRKTWNGRALVIIKGDRKKGVVRLKATASGLTENEININLK